MNINASSRPAPSPLLSTRRQFLTVAAKAMAGKERFEVAVKGVPKDGAKSSFEGQLGDCESS